MLDTVITNDKKRIPMLYRDATVVRELKIDTWKMVFDESGEKENIDSSNLSYESIVDFLCKSSSVNVQLISALKVIYELGDSNGRNLIEQASAGKVNLDASDEESSRDLAARLWQLSQRNIKYLNVLNRALVNLEYSKKLVNVREFAGDASFKITSIDKDKIMSLVSEWCLENKKSSVVDIDVYQIDNLWCCNIVRGDPWKNLAVINDNKHEQLTIRPAVCDHVRIDPKTGHIGIIARTEKMVSVYREVFGEVLTKNSKYFSGENICTLKPLLEKGVSIFDDKPSELRSVTVTELKWKRGRRDTIIVKGKDCFQIIRDLNIKLREGELFEAKFVFEFFGSNNHSRVKVRVPNRIHIPPDENEIFISRYLTDIGLKGRFDDYIDNKTFWRLYPWSFTELEWRQQIGEDFDTLKNAGCLKNVDLDMVLNPDSSSESDALQVVRLNNEEFIGVSDDENIAARTLTTTDREGYKLDLTKVGGLIGSSLLLEGEVYEVANGLWSLGLISNITSTQIKVYLATSEPSESTSALMKQHANGGLPVLIIPSDCFNNNDIAVVNTRITRLEFKDLLKNIIISLNLQNQVPAPLWRSENLILDPKQNRAWYKKIELKDVNFDEHDFKFALAVTKEKNKVVLKQDLNDHLSANRLDTSAAKNAKLKFMKKVKKSLNLVGAEECLTNEIFRPFKGGYILNCSAFIL